MDQSWAKFGPKLAKIAFRCALAMIDVGSCGQDHRRGGCCNDPPTHDVNHFLATGTGKGPSR